jgi:hypothetical protein
MNRLFTLLFCVPLLLLLTTVNPTSSFADAINRKEVVQRHNIHVHRTDSTASLTVGNGAFAFTVDATGLQTFPEYYKTGVSLGTQAEWGWHSFPNVNGYKHSETLKEYNINCRNIPYCTQIKSPERVKEAVEYFRVNDHRLQLANIGLDIILKDGKYATVADIKDIDQTQDLYTGVITSRFTVENIAVKVTTCASQENDGIAFKIESSLMKEGRILVRVRLPYPSGQFKDEGTNYADDGKHTSSYKTLQGNKGIIQHDLDDTHYAIYTCYNTAVNIIKPSAHYYQFKPTKNSGAFEFSALFTETKGNVSDYATTYNSSLNGWKHFWESGAAIDFAGSTDKRAPELERRIILSEYLTKVQCAGNFPPQETGLTYNSWYGKQHMEMYWWHAAHFALWGRTEYLERGMGWYFKVADGARAIAKRQGFEGLRWQKMTNNKGEEAPSSVGAFLIWQQPHFIYLADLIYRNKNDKATLDKYKSLVFETADFMASFPTYDSVNKRYNLGKGLIPAQECFNPMETFNPTYELAYWSWALATAQHWRELSGLPRNKKWDDVINHLAALPKKDTVYLATESTPDCYEPGNRRLDDHPAVLAAFASLPAANGLDTVTMKNTFNLVEKVWHWDHTWGWDFPLVAMTATRLNTPNAALDALFKDIKTNTYLPDGHNYQDDRLTIYLPGNGGLLSAIALMCAGSDDNHSLNPGFPKDGSWKVKWEGLKPMP